MPWLRQVPEHWDVDRAKWLFRKMDRPVRETDEVVTCFRDGTVTLRKNRRDRGFTESLKEIGYQGIRRGDLVIHGMDAFAGAVGVSDSDGKGTPVYSVCKPAPNVNAHYYTHVVREMARSEWILALAKGVRERSTDFRFDDFASQLVPLPPLDEQGSIVRFIDHVDRRLRRYIAAKKRLISLLDEQKQVIIHSAVTRGLEPEARLRPSGEEWLGDVPEQWKVRRLRTIADVALSGVDRHLSQGETVVRFLGTDTVYRVSSIDGATPLEKATATPSEISRFRLRRGDLVITKDSLVPTRIAIPALVTEDPQDLTVCGYHLALVRLRERGGVIPRYLFYVLSSRGLEDYFLSKARGTTIIGVGRHEIASAPVPAPSRSEQSAIVAYLDSATASIRMAVGRAERQISLAREYRTRLIDHVVTGKLDVRAAALQLSDEVEPLDALLDSDGSEDGADLDAVAEELMA